MEWSRLTLGERALLLVCCTDHPIATGRCGREIRLAHIYAELWEIGACTTSLDVATI